MNILIDKSFVKDINKIKDKNLLQKLNNFILGFEKTLSFSDIPSIKKIKGYKTYYRIRISDYRLGIEKINEDKICLIRFLHRKDIYKYFPKK